MRLLLDTHVFIWWRANESEIPEKIKTAVQEADDVFISIASAWEIAIKTSVGKLRLRASVEAGIKASYFEILPINLQHTDAVAVMPLHHRDPFDRMLVAQCLVDGLTLVTNDRRLQPYPISFLWL